MPDQSLSTFDLPLGIVVAFFPSISYTQRMGGHIGVELILQMMPAGLKHWTSVMVRLLGAVFVGLIAWEGALATWDAYRHGLTEFGYIRWPTWVSFVFVPIGAGLFTLRLLLEALVLITTGKGMENGPTEDGYLATDPTPVDRSKAPL